MAKKPIYIVRLNSEGYYSPKTEMPVPKDQAERMSHKDANRTSNHIRRFYKGAVMEPFDE